MVTYCGGQKVDIAEKFNKVRNRIHTEWLVRVANKAFVNDYFVCEYVSIK